VSEKKRMNWAPSAGPRVWRVRAQLLATIREFFNSRAVVEVSTPLLARHTVTDPHIHSFNVIREQGKHRLYLQTSPEHAMKRLLAFGSGPIYQICPAFRDEASGRVHNPEFTLVEWYQPGYTLENLIDEMDELLAVCLGAARGRRLSYAQAFKAFLDLDPFTCSRRTLLTAASDLGLQGAARIHTQGVLDFLFSHSVQPNLGPGVSYVFNYPVDQAAMSRIRHAQPPVARRVEVFVDGLELANGYEECLDAGELRLRFRRDLEQRAELGYDLPSPDEALLAAQEHGLPECSGIALGFDRLLMLALGEDTIAQVQTFPMQDEV